MKAAVVSAFDSPPHYADVADPSPSNPDEMVVQVVAAGLHPRVRSQANGSHYTSTDHLPLIPGIDGVGRGADGHLRYFVLPDTTRGAMAERTVIDVRRSVVLPASTDVVAVAAAMNPAMSSWVALRRRIDFQAGQKVLILGATGNAGRLAVQVARRFGSGEIIAAGRDPGRLAELVDLGATACVRLGGDPEAATARLGEASAEVDVVIDYLWGEPTEAAITAVVAARADRSSPLTWVQIGSVAGPTARIPSAALRAARLQIVGSGQGSVSPRDIVAELPGLAAAITAGEFSVGAEVRPLAEVEAVWTAAPPTGRRVVIVP